MKIKTLTDLAASCCDMYPAAASIYIFIQIISSSMGWKQTILESHLKRFPNCGKMVWKSSELSSAIQIRDISQPNSHRRAGERIVNGYPAEEPINFMARLHISEYRENKKNNGWCKVEINNTAKYWDSRNGYAICEFYLHFSKSSQILLNQQFITQISNYSL